MSGRLSQSVKAGLYDDYEEYITEQNKSAASLESMSVMMRKARREISFEPYIDIINGNDERSKSKVIEKLSKIISHNSVMLLKKALTDESSDIRIYAAGAMTRIEDSIRDKIRLVQHNVMRIGTPDEYFDLGDLLSMYAHLGLLEEKLENYYFNLSLDAYRCSLAQDPAKPHAIVRCAQCLLDLSKYEEAKELLNSAMDILPDNEEIMILRSKVYFRMNNFTEVVKCLRNIKMNMLGEEQKRIVEFWTAIS
ncbi:MAG: tetratricopeptide repeat protein [Candidatus Theseobacter exili]|nr:tetratricopeptide repeat protein [Candidatus Theseobacter exili]